MNASNKAAALAIAFLTLTEAASTRAVAQGTTIIYRPGPSFAILLSPPNTPAQLDLNGDGSVDFTFAGTQLLSLSPPDSMEPATRSWQFEIQGTGANEIMVDPPFVPVVSALAGGVIIDLAPTPGSRWQSGLAQLTGYFEDLVAMTHSSWSLTLGTLGEGFIPVRFYAETNLHYGWIRARVPAFPETTNGLPGELNPVILDWAYESLPDTSIAAGAVPEPTTATLIMITAGLGLLPILSRLKSKSSD